MTPLNSQLQLALLNRKKGRNALEKGFTLVELMIVIVIVGILSAVALPNFLNQTSKAKATECTSKAGALMGEVAAEALSSNTKAYTKYTDTLANDGSLAVATNDSDLCTFTTSLTAAPTNDIYTMNVEGKGELSGEYAAKFCVNYGNGKKESNVGKTLATVSAPDTDCV